MKWNPHSLGSKVVIPETVELAVMVKTLQCGFSLNYFAVCCAARVFVRVLQSEFYINQHTST